jgi:hypothetical protein
MALAIGDLEITHEKWCISYTRSQVESFDITSERFSHQNAFPHQNALRNV